MYRKIKQVNDRQSMWVYGRFDTSVIVSTSIDNTEVMIFFCNKDGKVLDWAEQYVSYENLNDHEFHMEQFKAINFNVSSDIIP